jgi:hypothetical protein
MLTPRYPPLIPFSLLALSPAARHQFPLLLAFFDEEHHPTGQVYYGDKTQILQCCSIPTTRVLAKRIHYALKKKGSSKEPQKGTQEKKFNKCLRK